MILNSSPTKEKLVSNETINSINFNQNNDLFIVGTNTGVKIYCCKSLKKVSEISILFIIQNLITKYF